MVNLGLEFFVAVTVVLCLVSNVATEEAEKKDVGNEATNKEAPQGKVATAEDKRSPYAQHIKLSANKQTDEADEEKRSPYAPYISSRNSDDKRSPYAKFMGSSSDNKNDKRSPYAKFMGSSAEDKRSPYAKFMGSSSDDKNDKRSPYAKFMGSSSEDKRSPYAKFMRSSSDDKRSPYAKFLGSHSDDKRSPYAKFLGSGSDDKRSPYAKYLGSGSDDKRSPYAKFMGSSSEDKRSPYAKFIGSSSDDKRSPYAKFIRESSEDKRSPYASFMGSNSEEEKRSPYARFISESSEDKRSPYARYIGSSSEDKRSPYAKFIRDSSEDKRSPYAKFIRDSSEDKRSPYASFMGSSSGEKRSPYAKFIGTSSEDKRSPYAQYLGADDKRSPYAKYMYSEEEDKRSPGFRKMRLGGGGSQRSMYDLRQDDAYNIAQGLRGPSYESLSDDGLVETVNGLKDTDKLNDKRIPSDEEDVRLKGQKDPIDLPPAIMQSLLKKPSSEDEADATESDKSRKRRSALMYNDKRTPYAGFREIMARNRELPVSKLSPAPGYKRTFVQMNDITHKMRPGMDGMLWSDLHSIPHFTGSFRKRRSTDETGRDKRSPGFRSMRLDFPTYGEHDEDKRSPGFRFTKWQSAPDVDGDVGEKRLAGYRTMKLHGNTGRSARYDGMALFDALSELEEEKRSPGFRTMRPYDFDELEDDDIISNGITKRRSYFRPGDFVFPSAFHKKLLFGNRVYQG